MDIKKIKPDEHITSVSDTAFRDGAKSAVAEYHCEYYFLKAEQQKAVGKRDYFKEWATTYY